MKEKKSERSMDKAKKSSLTAVSTSDIVVAPVTSKIFNGREYK